MNYLFQVWTKPRFSLTAVDEFVMGIEGMALIVLLAVAWTALQAVSTKIGAEQRSRR